MDGQMDGRQHKVWNGFPNDHFIPICTHGMHGKQFWLQDAMMSNADWLTIWHAWVRIPSSSHSQKSSSPMPSSFKRVISPISTGLYYNKVNSMPWIWDKETDDEAAIYGKCMELDELYQSPFIKYSWSSSSSRSMVLQAPFTCIAVENAI